MTDSKMEALARQLVACPHWRWIPGMRTHDGRLVINVDTIGKIDPRAWINWVERFQVHQGFVRGFASLPDLAEPPTIGCLLQLVREAWRLDMFVIAVSRNGGRWEVWARGSDDGPFAWGDTEAEALVAAILAAPEAA